MRDAPTSFRTYSVLSTRPATKKGWGGRGGGRTKGRCLQAVEDSDSKTANPCKDSKKWQAMFLRGSLADLNTFPAKTFLHVGDVPGVNRIVNELKRLRVHNRVV